MTVADTDSMWEAAWDAPSVLLRRLAGGLLALLVFTIPWEDQFVVEGFGTLCRAVGLAAFAGALLAKLVEGRLRIPRPAHLVLAAFVLWAALTAFWTVDEDATRAAILTYLQLLALLWLVLEFAETPASQRQLLRAYVLGTCVSAVATISSYQSAAVGAYWQRYVAQGFDPNDLCVILALSIPMSVYLAGADSGQRWGWCWGLHPGLVLFAALLTASRGGFLACCVALLSVPLLWGRLPRASKAVAGCAAGLLLAALLAFSPAHAFERLASIPQEIGGGSFGDRGGIWRAGWELFRSHPLLGVGVGAFAPAVNQTLGESVVAHNAFLTLLVETGLAGFLLFALAGYLLLRRMAGLGWWERRFWGVALATWLVGAMSLSWAHRKPTWLLFGLLAVLCRPQRADGRVKI